MSEEQIMIDTKGFLNPCKKIPTMVILTSSCAKCKYHGGIIEFWPGKDEKEIKVDISEMTVETVIDVNGNDTGKNRKYDIQCTAPTRKRVTIFFEFPDKTEE